MYRTTNKNPEIKEINPYFIESSPRSEPTFLSSIIFIGAGKAPALRRIDNWLASSVVKLPDIWPLPVKIGSRITGALKISLSRIIARGLPTLAFVAFANFEAPTESNLKLTTAVLFCLSKPGWASFKF